MCCTVRMYVYTYVPKTAAYEQMECKYDLCVSMVSCVGGRVSVSVNS